MIPVTKPFQPDFNEYSAELEKVWDRGYFTNQGPCVLELEKVLSHYLGVRNFHFLSNGTIALQMALNSLKIDCGEVITTPFSYVATISSLLWERCTPVFVDIEDSNFCIDANKVEAAITKKTQAILAVHVFGYACNVEKLDMIGAVHNLKVIYDGAHAFGSRYHGRSLLDYGDVSTCSFHATKLFHTVEGGACIVRDIDVSSRLELAKRFGHNQDKHIMLGINAKGSELHAAMGLVNFRHIEEIITRRRELSEYYDLLLGERLVRPSRQDGLEYNYAYYPVVFKNEKQLLDVFRFLGKKEIYPRRYFYPSLNKLSYLESNSSCPTSEDISARIACLPLYLGLNENDIDIIAENIFNVI